MVVMLQKTSPALELNPVASSRGVQDPCQAAKRKSLKGSCSCTERRRLRPLQRFFGNGFLNFTALAKVYKNPA